MGNYKWGFSRVTILITHIRGLITLLITTREPPSRMLHVSEPTLLFSNSGAAKPTLPGPYAPTTDKA